MRTPRALAVCGYVALVACGGPSSAPSAQPTYGALGGEVASVGQERIDGALVGEVARARGLSPRVALGALVDDALMAQGVRAQRIDHTPEVSWGETSAVARVTSKHLMDEARAKGPPSDDELSTVKVVHALVLRSRSVPEARLRFAAQSIVDAVAGAKSAADFQARAKAVSTDVRVTIEELPVFDAAGRMEDGSQVDPDFTAAAFSLRAPGDTSPIVETPFGWHVIRLVERERPTASIEERRADLAEPVVELRARVALSALLARRRKRTGVEVSNSADEIMALTFPVR
jgi:hypothetical protein